MNESRGNLAVIPLTALVDALVADPERLASPQIPAGPLPCETG